MLKRSNSSKMGWLKNKINQSSPVKSANAQSNSDLKYQGTSRFDQCTYVFNDGTIEQRLKLHISDIKILISTVKSDVEDIHDSETNASSNDINVVCDNIRSMSTLITSQVTISELTSDLLNTLCTEKFVKILTMWTKFCFLQNQHVDRLIEEQLFLYDIFITQSNQQFLTEKELLQPFLELLELCSLKLQDDLNSNSRLEEKLLFTLHQVCIGVTSGSEVLDLIFDGTSADDKFSVFNLLIPFVHREGVVGQQARDALLLIMSLSAKHDKIGVFVANESNFCPVLATGLSGLYSSLPCKLEYPSDDWHYLSDEDVSHMPDLKMFLNSLEFCNAVIQASHPAICTKLLEFIMDGFLHPVIGPALNQDLLKHPAKFHDLMLLTTIEEVVAATAYLDLFVRKITEPSLLKVFVDFILFGDVDDIPVLDLLIARISSQLTRLCVVTLMFFYSLVDLNCEDIMFHLIFKHIMPGKHIMLSQHRSVNEMDLYSLDAEKFLSMIPECFHFSQGDNMSTTSSEISQIKEDEKPTSKFGRFNFKSKKSNPSTPVSTPLKGRRSLKVETPSSQTTLPNEDSSYGDYLTWARYMITACNESCNNWLFRYDTTRSLIIKEGQEVADMKVTSDLMVTSDDSTNVNGEELNVNGEELNVIGKGFKSVENPEERNDLSLFMTTLNELQETVDDETDLPDLLKEIDRLYDRIFCSRKDEKVKAADERVDVSRNIENIDLLNKYLTSSDKPSLGAFLEALFSRVDRMVQSTLYVNLQLTSLIARLACYPQPLLRSIILSHNLIFQPSVKSFLQILNSVKNKLEEYLMKLPQRETSLIQAHQFLVYRISHDVSLVPFEIFKNAGKRRSIGLHDIFRSNVQKQNRLVFSSSSAQYVHRISGGGEEEEKESIERKNAIYAALVFKEFLKELAAISQEHAIVCLS